MKMKSQKSIVLKRNFKNLISILLPIAKKVINNQINQIKSCIMRKIRPNKIRNTPKRLSNRGIKYLENIINTPKIVNENPPIATKPKIAKPNIDGRPEIATKPKIAIKPKNANKNYDEYKKNTIKSCLMLKKKLVFR